MVFFATLSGVLMWDVENVSFFIFYYSMHSSTAASAVFNRYLTLFFSPQKLFPWVSEADRRHSAPSQPSEHGDIWDGATLQRNPGTSTRGQEEHRTPHHAQWGLSVTYLTVNLSGSPHVFLKSFPDSSSFASFANHIGREDPWSLSLRPSPPMCFEKSGKNEDMRNLDFYSIFLCLMLHVEPQWKAGDELPWPSSNAFLFGYHTLPGLCGHPISPVLQLHYVQVRPIINK